MAKFLVLKSFIGKAFRERGLDGVKKRRLKWLETSDFSPQAFKKLKREPALAKEEIDNLKKLVELDNQKRRQKKEKSSKS
ncbi:transposase [Aggregatibacter actinomycetemcomitans]|uniref:transposase n=1 Tax=Aggregatibacter actinomycetemcomitans TaxID=714 RepID=UPI001F1CFF6E|nr:transposase [Aggregatibacter actinomycetemcomitans]